MKTLVSFVLCCLAALGLGQFANPIPVGRIVADGNKLAVETSNGLKPVFLFGTNITYTGCFPPDPKAAADYLRNHGYNWVRLADYDELMWLPASDPKRKTPEDLLPFISACEQYGIRVSTVGLMQYKGLSKMSVLTGLGRASYAAYLQRMADVLKHPNVWMFQLLNENYTEIKNTSSISRVPEFYAWGKDQVQRLGFTGIVGDGGDMNIDPPLFQATAKMQDITLCHLYGTHPQGGRYRYESWAENGYMAGTSFWLQSLSGKPMVFQEVGCLPFAADRAVNEVFIASEARKRCSGLAFFQSFSNLAQWRFEFSQVDDFSDTTDYPRMVARFAGALIAKYGEGPEIEYYNGHSLTPSKRDANYRRLTDKVKVFITREKGTVIVTTSAKKRYVILVDASLIRGYAATTAADGWITTVARGGKQVGFWEGPFVDLGAPVSGAYRINPWSLKKEGTMAKSGNGFTADRSCAIYEVNLK